MQNLCARREYCIFDVEQKLFDWGLPKEEIDDIVCDLIANDFVNEQRYANAYAHDRIKFSGFGRQKVAMKLAQKRLSTYCIKKAKQYVSEEDYLACFELIAQKKWQDLGEGKSPQIHQKLYRFLQQRGFENNLIQSFINQNLK